MNMYNWPSLLTRDTPVLSSERTPHNDKTVAMKTSTKNLSRASDEKTDRLTDHQS
jgi:hypothetical protein